MNACRTNNNFQIYFFNRKIALDHVICQFFFQNGGSVSGWEIYYENIAMGNVFCQVRTNYQTKMHFSIPDTQDLKDETGSSYTVNDNISLNSEMVQVK